MKRKRPYRPKRKNKIELFKALFHYWSVKLTDKTYPIVRDNRFTGHLVTHYDYETRTVKMSYNSRVLAHWDFANIVLGVFHEIGHILQGDLPYETFEEQVVAEKDAEEFALRMMKKYYTKREYDSVVTYSRNKYNQSRFRRKFPVHYEAFSSIKEYQP